MFICNKLSTVDVNFCRVCFEEDDGCTDSISCRKNVLCAISGCIKKKCSITDHSLCLGCYSTQQCPDPKNVQSPTGNGAVQNSSLSGAEAELPVRSWKSAELLPVRSWSRAKLQVPVRSWNSAELLPFRSWSTAELPVRNLPFSSWSSADFLPVKSWNSAEVRSPPH